MCHQVDFSKMVYTVSNLGEYKMVYMVSNLGEWALVFVSLGKASNTLSVILGLE